MTSKIDDRPRICVIGAGAMGGVLAVRLALGRSNVFVVDRDPEHLRAIKREGLKIEGAWTASARMDAVHIDELVEPVDLAIVAVKSAAVKSVVNKLSPLLRENSRIVLLQNGLVAHSVATQIAPRFVFPASVAYGGHLVSPGHIRHGADGDFAIGSYIPEQAATAKGIVAALAPFGPVAFHANIWGRIWGKTLIAVLLAAAAVDGRPTYEVFGDRGARRTLRALVLETIGVSRAENIKLEPVKGVDFSNILSDSRPDDPEADKQFDRLVEIARSGLPHKTHSGVYYSLKVNRQSTGSAELLNPILDRAAKYSLPCRVLENLRDTLERLEADPDNMSPTLLRSLA
jgi:2-dehydropantoate 2-reductase